MRLPLAALALALACTPSHAQTPVGDLDAKPKPKQYIAFAAEPQTIPANKRATVELRFNVADGYHVNSHTPKSELLIPTNLTLAETPGTVTDAPTYPAGTSFSFSFSANEKLDVYSGAFTIKLPVTTSPGSHTLTGSLHYQACDHAACYPPRTLAISVPINAK